MVDKTQKALHPFTLWIASDEVPTEKLALAIQNFHKFLQELTKEVIGTERNIRWTTSVSKGSANLTFTPVPVLLSAPEKRKLYAVNDKIFKAINEDSEPPNELTPAVAKPLAALAEVTKPSSQEKSLVMALVRPNNRFEITPQIIAPLNKAMHILEFYGFIEGELQGINSRNGFKLAIYERIQGRCINCYIKRDRDDLFDLAKTLFDKRVQAYGTLKCKKDGTPLSITLESISPLPTEHQIQDLSELRGILKKYG